MDSITVMLDGADIPNLRLFFKEMVKELQFPRYTNNIQTFDEQINDLSWLEGAKVRISISNAKEFLIEEETQIRKTVLSILLNAMESGEAESPILVIVSKD
ncbi:MAG: hypothetical protein CMP63_05725 [Flavobacteriales bacterium]|nr:hypothetical protein [Flavobacteriales bacterium]